jgi:hypothetical protein
VIEIETYDEICFVLLPTLCLDVSNGSRRNIFDLFPKYDFDILLLQLLLELFPELFRIRFVRELILGVNECDFLLFFLLSRNQNG